MHAKVSWLKGTAVVDEEIVEMGEWTVWRTGVWLLGLQKLFQVHL